VDDLDEKGITEVGDDVSADWVASERRQSTDRRQDELGYKRRRGINSYKRPTADERENLRNPL
jgi:hypothetical protein